MSRLSKDVQELEAAISNFMAAFELVFKYDWEMTKLSITDNDFIQENGTFIEPGVEDESNNWANRGYLLSRYRQLLQVMEKNGIPTDVR